MRLIYTLLIQAYAGVLRLAAFFHPKARKWVEGRRRWQERYRSAFQKKGPVLWVHAASLGEFEQGRPVIEAFRETFPGWQVVLTFFSPSGYEIRRDYPHAEFVCYLPADTPANARDFLDWLRPDTVLFVKYEFWANYLFELRRRGIRTLLVSALFRPGQPFFRWYGSFWGEMLATFEHFFLQNKNSATLLAGIGFENCTVAGDTRIDRVLKLAETAPANAIVAAFAAASPGEGEPFLLIAGSTWAPDEALLFSVLQNPDFEKIKTIVAPHDPSEKHIGQLISNLPVPCVLYSKWNDVSDADRSAARALVIDNIGMLNTLYRYGSVAYIGGGFGSGIHNTLEPAAFGLPVLFGPKFEKFEEARQFVSRGGAFAVLDAAALAAVLKKIRDDASFYQNASQAVSAYLEENRGATGKVIGYLKSRPV